MTKSHIPHIEPYLTDAETKAVTRYMRSKRYLTESIYTKRLEDMIGGFLHVPYVSMVPNGTSALYLSLLAAGVKPGDQVLVPDYTMIATVNAVRMAGAKPVLVDICEDTHCLNVEEAPSKAILSMNAKAMIYVDINGRGTPEEVVVFCKAHKMVLIEDACQSFGSESMGKKLGTFGRFGCFSLGFHKIITTGQGGFVASHTKEDYEAIERLKDFGRLEGGNDVHDYLGFNFKFTDLQAIIGIEQMKTIEWRMEQKRKIFRWYWGFEPSAGYVPWFIELMSEKRDAIEKNLEEEGIATRKLYPPIHTQKIYKQKGFPVATRVSKRGLWLPSSLSLSKKDVFIIKRIIEKYANI